MRSDRYRITVKPNCETLATKCGVLLVKLPCAKVVHKNTCLKAVTFCEERNGTIRTGYTSNDERMTRQKSKSLHQRSLIQNGQHRQISKPSRPYPVCSHRQLLQIIVHAQWALTLVMLAGSQYPHTALAKSAGVADKIRSKTFKAMHVIKH